MSRLPFVKSNNPPTRNDVLRAAGAAFRNADLGAIVAIIDEYGVEPYERERERVQCAIVKLCEGDLAKLRYFLGVAKQDYRDVLFWADHPDEAKVDTPEKRKRVREMIERLGMKPPPGLDDA